VVLIASFVGLAVLWQQPRLQRVAARAMLSLPTAMEIVCGALGVAAFLGLIYAGFAGAQDAQRNIVPTVVFVVFWVGIPSTSVVLGDVFSAFNPWRAVGRATGWLAARLGTAPQPLPYPQRLGRWPAAVGLLVFAWVELVDPDRDDPSTLAVLAMAYAAAQLIGMTLYVERERSRNGDAFGVWFSFLGRLSPLEWRDRSLRLRPPLSGVVNIDIRRGTVALIVVAIGTTSFDGFSQGRLWNSWVGDLVPRVTDLGVNVELASEIVFTAGLLLAVALIAGLWRLGIQGVHGVDRAHDPTTLGRRFAHSLVPIGVAYLVAHYLSLLMFQGQAMGYLASDPLGGGADLLGTAAWQIDDTWLAASTVRYVQVAALIAGHVAGLTLAHDRAIDVYTDPRTATRSQYWMLGVMVSFTCLALYLLSAAAQ